MLIRAANWQLPFLNQRHHFQNRNLWYTFQMLFKQKRVLTHYYFLYENESIQHCRSYDLRQTATFLVVAILFFSSGPRFRVRVRFSDNAFLQL